MNRRWGACFENQTYIGISFLLKTLIDLYCLKSMKKGLSSCHAFGLLSPGQGHGKQRVISGPSPRPGSQHCLRYYGSAASLRPAARIPLPLLQPVGRCLSAQSSGTPISPHFCSLPALNSFLIGSGVLGGNQDVDCVGSPRSKLRNTAKYYTYCYICTHIIHIYKCMACMCIYEYRRIRGVHVQIK